MYLKLTKRFREALGAHIRDKYGLDIGIVTERPPKIEMGEAASIVAAIPESRAVLWSPRVLPAEA